MLRSAFINMLTKEFCDTDTIIFVTKALNQTSSKIIATLVGRIDYSNEDYIIINNYDEKGNNITYYVPYQTIIMTIKQ